MMRLFAAVVVFAACARTPNSPHVQVDLPVAHDTVAPVAAAALEPLDEATVKAKSRAFLDAVDHFDGTTVADRLAPRFVFFADQRFSDATLFAQTLANRKAQHLSVRSRVFSEERTYATSTSAVYVGHDTEHIPSDGEHPAADLEGWDTLMWTREGERWKLAHWAWQVAGLEAERAMWNQVFKTPFGFNLKPNQLLVDTVKGKKAGTALDLAMGQGRNAVFLARQGWKVTGVDISDAGIRVALAAAAGQKVKLETVTADLDTFDLGKERWDLVTLIYAGDDHALIERIKPSLRKGGLVVVELFAKGALEGSGAGGFARGELATLFKEGFTILKDEEVEDTADWAGQQRTKLARFVAQKR